MVAPSTPEFPTVLTPLLWATLAIGIVSLLAVVALGDAIPFVSIGIILVPATSIALVAGWSWILEALRPRGTLVRKDDIQARS